MPRFLGQHFLVNKSAIKKIISALEIKAGDTIIEIGPGHGELTDELRIKNRELRIIGIEKDRNLARYLQKKFVSDKNITIIQGDALKVLPSVIHDSRFKIQEYKIVGNIPYYITGRLLRIIGEIITDRSYQLNKSDESNKSDKSDKPEIVLTIQKEVAERICAKPGKMNLLAASIQFWAEPKIIMRLKPKDFLPPPKVDSAIIKLTTNNLQLTTRNSQLTTKEIKNYYKLIKIVFKQPRKTILNNLNNELKTKNLKLKTKLMDKEQLLCLLKKMGYNENSRPQDLSIENLINLAAILW
jgi:16S rRNA (adenine1518-N6/adenine1519-N6)-dimethyltransferase